MKFARWRRYGLGLAALVVLSGPTVADDALPVETLTRLKSATVFLKLDAGKVAARGSGFVIRTEGQTAYIVTNNHVVDLTPKGQTRPAVLNWPVTVVFNSGARDEQSLVGQVIAADPRRDLAIVKVAGLKAPPPMIDLSRPAELVETMPVYILGFPLGELLATNQGNPAITVGKGSVASLRNNERGELATVQVAGDMTPGNSGGPVVDAQGRLVGVTAATIRGATIGFAIPAATLIQNLKGRVLDHHFVTRPMGPGALDIRVELGVFDPFNQLKGVSFYYLPRGKAAEKKLAEAAGVQKVALTRTQQQLAGNFTLGPAGLGDENVCFQAVYADGDDRHFFSNPRERLFRRSGIGNPQPQPQLQPTPQPQPVVEVPKPPPPAETPGKTTVDLIPLIDPVRDAVHGRWTVSDGTLRCNDMNGVPRVQVLYRPPQEYDLVVVFQQPKLRNGIFLLLPGPQGGSCAWGVGKREGRQYQLFTKPEKHGNLPELIKPNTVHTAVVQVRRDGFRCLLDGKEVLNHKTDFRDLTSDRHKLADPTLVGVGCDDPAVFHYVRVVEITGQGIKVGPGSLKPPAPPETPGKTTIDLVSLLDPARDAIHGKWSVSEGVLRCHDSNFAPRVEVPYRPAEEYDVVVVFSQPKLRNGVFVALPNPKGSPFWAGVGGRDGKEYLLSARPALRGEAPTLIKPNTAHTLVVQVRKDSVRCLVDGKEWLHHKTDFGDLSTDPWHQARDKTLLAVGCDDPTVFHYVRLVEITGQGTKTR